MSILFFVHYHIQKTVMRENLMAASGFSRYPAAKAFIHFFLILRSKNLLKILSFEHFPNTLLNLTELPVHIAGKVISPSIYRTFVTGCHALNDKQIRVNGTVHIE